MKHDYRLGYCRLGTGWLYVLLSPSQFAEDRAGRGESWETEISEYISTKNYPLAILLNAMGLPTDYIGMFMAIDILCDMPKTLLNAYSVSCSAIIVAHSEGESLHV